MHAYKVMSPLLVLRLQRYPRTTREQCLRQALSDTARDLCTEEDAIATQLLREAGRQYDIKECKKLVMLFAHVRESYDRYRVPFYWEICEVTGCSKNNRSLKYAYWVAVQNYITRFIDLKNPSCQQNGEQYGCTMTAKLAYGEGIEEEKIAGDLMRRMGWCGPEEVCRKLIPLLTYVKAHEIVPNESTICILTGCSCTDRTLQYWFSKAAQLYASIISGTTKMTCSDVKNNTVQSGVHVSPMDRATDFVEHVDQLSWAVGRSVEDDVSNKLILLLKFVRGHQRVPHHGEICAITGCNCKNQTLVHLLLAAADRFLFASMYR